MRRKFFLFVVLVFYFFVLRWKNPMEGLLRPSMDITEVQQQQNSNGKAQLVSHLPQQEMDCNETRKDSQEKPQSAAFSTASILSQFMIAYTPSSTILIYHTCE